MSNCNQAEIHYAVSRIRRLAKLCTVTFDAWVVTAVILARAGRTLSRRSSQDLFVRALISSPHVRSSTVPMMTQPSRSVN